MPLLHGWMVHVPWRKRADEKHGDAVPDAKCQHQHGAKQQLSLECRYRKCADHEWRRVGSDEERKSKPQQICTEDAVPNNVKTRYLPPKLDKPDHRETHQQAQG